MKVLDHGFVELVDSMPQRNSGPVLDFGTGDQRIVDAARVSIAGEGVQAVSDSRKLIRYLYKNEHMTLFETVRFTFRAKLPLFVARQWVRHRASSFFNEMSARYGQLPGEFYIPEVNRMKAQSSNNKQGSSYETIQDPEPARRALRRHCRESYDLYEGLLARGLARELARMVLPVNIYTSWYWSVDLRNLMHFLHLRLDSHAQYEIRVYAEAMAELVRPIAPCAMQVFEEGL